MSEQLIYFASQFPHHLTDEIHFTHLRTQCKIQLKTNKQKKLLKFNVSNTLLSFNE